MSRRGKIIIKEEQKVQEIQEIQKINNFLYFLDHTFVKKYCISSGIKYQITKYDYLPLINNTKLNLEELSNSKFLIYLKCVKATKSSKSGFYGYFTGGHILISGKQMA